MHALDPHERPPEHIRNVYKKYQRMKSQDLDEDPAMLDVERRLSSDLDRKLRVVQEWDRERLTATFSQFGGGQGNPEHAPYTSKLPVYEHDDMPGRSCYESHLPALRFLQGRIGHVGHGFKSPHCHSMHTSSRRTYMPLLPFFAYVSITHHTYDLTPGRSAHRTFTPTTRNSGHTFVTPSAS